MTPTSQQAATPQTESAPTLDATAHEAANGDAARAPVMPPEAASLASTTADAARTAPPKPEAAALPASTPPTVSTITVNTPPAIAMLVDPDSLKRAEQQLAAYIGQRIDLRLTEGLELTLNPQFERGKSGLELCLKGKQIPLNAGLLSEQVNAALKLHPAFDQFFKQHDKAPRAERPADPAKADMLHIHVGHLSAAEYAKLIHETANTTVLKPVAAPVVRSEVSAAAANDAAIPQNVVQAPAQAVALEQQQQAVVNGR